MDLFSRYQVSHLRTHQFFCNNFSHSCCCVIAICWNWVSITLCQSVFLYLAYNITRNSLIKWAVYCLNFNPSGFLIPWNIMRFCFDSELKGTDYAANPKIIASTVMGFVPSMLAYIVSKWRNASPWTSVQIYGTFASPPSVPDAAWVMLKLQMNNKNSAGSTYWDKTNLNS